MPIDSSSADSGRILVGVPRETFAGEARVALVPAVLAQLAKAGIDVVVEQGAGQAAGIPDQAYLDHGARIASRDEVFAASIIVQVRTSVSHALGRSGDTARFRPDQVVIGLADPLINPDGVKLAADHRQSLFALEFVPRVTRAQSMDVLSSQATVTGYKAVLLAANRLTKLFPMLTTAAGTMPPAQVFVVGAGVAGLTAIATARRLGAVVQAYDVRPAAQAEIESVGARAVVLPLETEGAEDKGGYARQQGEEFYRRQQELMAQVVAGVDVVITTALIPGRKAPVLINEAAVLGMQPGSVIVDCAAERGGNCALTRPDEVVVTSNGVTILGPTNLPGEVPRQASTTYSKNVTNFLMLLVRKGQLNIDMDDQIIAESLVSRGGEILNPRVRDALAKDGP